MSEGLWKRLTESKNVKVVFEFADGEIWETVARVLKVERTQSYSMGHTKPGSWHIEMDAESFHLLSCGN